MNHGIPAVFSVDRRSILYLRDAGFGAYLGGRFTAKRVKSRTLTLIFAVALVLLAIQRVLILLGA